MSAADLEAAVLGAVLDAEGPALRSNAGALMDQAGLRPEDFSDARARVAWSIMQRLVARRRPTDAVAVYSAGRAARALGEEALGWLRGLQVGNALDRERFADLVESMRGAARVSALTTALERGAAQLKAPGADFSKVAGELETLLRDLTSNVTDDGTGDEDVMELSDEWDRAEQPGAKPVLMPTGIPVLDEVIGGLVPNLNVIAGLPSVGKSALLATMLDAQLGSGIKAGLFGLEDGTKWLARRIVARRMLMRVRDVGRVRRTREQQELWVEAGAEVSRLLKGLRVYRHDSINTDELCRRAVSWIVQHGVEVIYVDHGGEVEHVSRHEDFRLKVAETYRRLRNLAIRYNVPVVVLAHTGRPADDNEQRPPRPSEIAESAYIERRARLVLGVWAKHDENAMRATVLKQTEGPRNITVRIERLAEAAMLDATDAEVVDLNAEKAAAVKAARERREAARPKPTPKPPPPQLPLVPDDDD